MLESPGSPIFKQKRIGIGGKEFSIFKLRSMRLGAEHGSFLTTDGDLRLTRFGRVLRQTKLDELPQLWNVLTGDMSLIGPRPLSTRETEYLRANLHFDAQYPGFQPKVRPGLTGLEQIRRNRKMSYRERFALNEAYEKHVTFKQDTAIFLSTFALCRVVSIAAVIGAAIETVFLVQILVSLNVLT